MQSKCSQNAVKMQPKFSQFQILSGHATSVEKRNSDFSNNYGVAHIFVHISNFTEPSSPRQFTFLDDGFPSF